MISHITNYIIDKSHSNSLVLLPISTLTSPLISII